MHRYLAFFAVGAFALSGCVATAPKKVSIASPFDPVLTKQMLEKGSNTIRGSALIRQRGGGVVTCAGQEVRLAPATPYSSERVRAIFGFEEGGYYPAFGSPPISFEGEPPEYRALTVSTRCDAQGYFKFDQVANGSFFVNTIITWKVSDYVTEGGSITQRVTLSGGETKEIVLSPR